MSDSGQFAAVRREGTTDEYAVAWLPDDNDVEPREIALVGSYRDATIAASLLNALDATAAEA